MAELLHSEAESYSSSENKLWESDSDWCSTSSSSTTCADEMEWFDDIMDSDSYDSDTSYSSQESISQQQKINMADIENASDHHNCKVDYNMEDETSKCKELNNSSESLSQHSGNITDSTTTDVKQSPDDHLEKCSLAAHTSIKRKRLSCPVKGCNAKNLLKLSQHLLQFHNITSKARRTRILQKARKVMNLRVYVFFYYIKYHTTYNTINVLHMYFNRFSKHLDGD